MSGKVIEIQGLTKDYGNGKGIFDVSIEVGKGEVFGFLGPNGAGKTTTIRHLMGFIRPDEGSCFINGMDCYDKAAKVQEQLGYLAGEIAFLEDLSGREMLEFIADMKGIKDRSKITELMERFELDPKGKIKKMSKGMKQKLGIICAFMNDPEVIILDEPTSGVDPLMQNRFIDLILEEKQKGKTIFMSSHIFEEIERTCDRVAIIKEGKLISIEDMATLKMHKRKTYIVTFESEKEATRFMTEEANREISSEKRYEMQLVNAVQIKVNVGGDINPFLGALARYKMQDLDIEVQTLEELFLHFYGGDEA